LLLCSEACEPCGALLLGAYGCERLDVPEERAPPTPAEREIIVTAIVHVDPIEAERAAHTLRKPPARTNAGDI
tara:strand:+ start:1152 stop:1370 length:219 start_codon:yes stop_codon:yes gene_type:complete